MVLAPARHARAAEAEWDGYASVASDYVYRGVSLLDSNPNLQAGFESHVGDNFLIGAWATNVDHQWLYTSRVSGHVELNLYTGADVSCGPQCRARFIVTAYVFPGSATRDWQEATASVAFAERVGASFSWSPHGLGSWASSRTLEAWYVQPLSRNTSLTVDAGNVSIRSFDYWYARAGVSHRFDRWVVDLSRYVSDPAFRRIGFDEHTQRFVLSISTAF
jgi:uncharacterized protein (TIGR02001 family)